MPSGQPKIVGGLSLRRIVPKLGAGGWLRSHRTRRVVLILALGVVLTILALRGFDTYLGGYGSVGSLDFVEYWSAARLAMEGGNPYDETALLEMERVAGWRRDQALMMWNPPWTLALVMPLALLPFDLASFVWLILQVVLVLTAGFSLWRYFAPEDRRYWIGFLLAAGFVPGWFALHLGQISPWLLSGVVGFLWAARKSRDLAAGAALALLMIKPHVAYLFFLAALGWTWRKHRWGILIGGLVALTGASGIVLLIDRDIFGKYLVATAEPPLHFATPTLGTWLRILFGVNQYWLQFLPSVVGGLGLLFWLCRRRGAWRWEVLAGPLLLASVATAAYGWSHDQILLVPAVAAMASRARRWSGQDRYVFLGFLVAFQLAVLVQNRCQLMDYLYVWHPWALAGLYCWAARFAASKGTDA